MTLPASVRQMPVTAAPKGGGHGLSYRPPSPSSGPPLLSGSASPPLFWGTAEAGLVAVEAAGGVVAAFGVGAAAAASVLTVAAGAAGMDPAPPEPAGLLEPPLAEPQPATTRARPTAPRLTSAAGRLRR